MTHFKTTLLIAALIGSVAVTTAQAHSGPGGFGGREDVSFETLDLNSDGNLTIDELQAQAQIRFDAADTNGDGGLSAEEMAAQADGRRANRLERMIERVDANEDGLVQLSEMQDMRDGRRGGADPQDMFDRMDADSDGVVTEEEFTTAKEARHDRRGGDTKRDG